MICRTRQNMATQYPKGTKIRLIHMVDDPYPIPDGTVGSVQFLDSAGHIHVNWENGSTLALIPGIDHFEKI